MTRHVHKSCAWFLHRFCMDCTRALLVVLLVFGLLAPRMSAVLAQVIPGIQTMVICTGDQMITLTIGADGVPVETVSENPHPCVMADGVTLATTDLPFWQKLAADHARSFAILESPRAVDDHLIRLSPSRAPPVVI